MHNVDDVVISNFKADIDKILLEFVIRQNKKDEADSQAIKPE